MSRPFGLLTLAFHGFADGNVSMTPAIAELVLASSGLAL
jgi:hypothetical protein